MELYLIRHPRPDVADGVCYGSSNVGLAEDPARVAARLRPLLPADYLLVSSPLARCRQLAEALSTKLDFEPRLAEMDFGDWELQPFDDIDLDAIDAWAANPFGFTPPGGESVRTMAARAQAAFAEILVSAEESEREALVIVAHGGPLRALTAQLLKLPEDRWLALDFDFGRVSHFSLHGESVRMRGFNL